MRERYKEAVASAGVLPGATSDPFHRAHFNATGIGKDVLELSLRQVVVGGHQDGEAVVDSSLIRLHGTDRVAGKRRLSSTETADRGAIFISFI